MVCCRLGASRFARYVDDGRSIFDRQCGGGVAVVLGFLIIYRTGRTPLAISPILEQVLPEDEAIAVLELDGPEELAEEPKRYAAE